MQQPYGCGYAEKQRDEERKQSEHQSALQVETQVKQVDLDAGQKHEVEQSDLSEDAEAGVVVEHVEAERSHADAGHYHADDVGYFQSVQQ